MGFLLFSLELPDDMEPDRMRVDGLTTSQCTVPWYFLSAQLDLHNFLEEEG